MLQLVREIAAIAVFLLGGIFAVGGAVGLFRFPDPYSRLQAGSLAGTTAVVAVLIGALILSPSWAIAARIIIVLVFFLLSSPTGAHIVARFAWNSGIPLWKAGDKTRKGRVPKAGPKADRKADRKEGEA